jgi:high-affinity nickel-transport protein
MPDTVNASVYEAGLAAHPMSILANAPPSPNRKSRVALCRLYLGLVGFNLAAWSCAFLVFRTHPVMLGTAFLAYILGLRHGLDADHIVAIDNVTRRLIQEGKRPLTAGLFFSLGHSSVVFAASAAIAFGLAPMANTFAGLRAVGALFGTGMSALFLFAIAGANIAILISMTRMFRRAAAGDEPGHDAIEHGGILARFFRRSFANIRASWQMYPLGLLFGLGFDTATEIAVLGLSAAGAAQGLSLWAILIFPALFAAGMTLIDTTDNVLMVGAYGWAFINPSAKLHYNITITAISILVALAIGGIETLGLLADHFRLSEGAWRMVVQLNGNLAALGLLVIGIFTGVWLLSAAVYLLRRVTVTTS